MIIILFSLLVSAKDLPGEELFAKPTQEGRTQGQRPGVEVAPARGRAEVPFGGRVQRGTRGTGATSSLPNQPGNLPSSYYQASGRVSTNSELIQPPKGSSTSLDGIRVGESLELVVDHWVIAFPDEKSPVVAIGSSGRMRGIKLIGESSLERNSKRIFINFTRLVSGDKVYTIKGQGLAANGQPGIEGEYYSREAEFFTGEFIANFAAGYFDGMVPRRTNAFGQIEADTSVDSAMKKGLAAGALSSADRFREKLKRVPEFSQVRGPFEIRVLILEKAKSI